MLCQLCSKEFPGLCPDCWGSITYQIIADMRLANSHLASENAHLRMIARWLLDVLSRRQDTETRQGTETQQYATQQDTETRTAA